MPPVLDPANSKVDGLAFLGLSLARKSQRGHPDSVTHQTAFDLNLVQDRHYKYVFSTNDDGWLVGGGEPGPPDSYKLAAKDSAHVEIIRLGTFRKEWGGVSKEKVISTLQAGKILIPQMEVLPTAVVANGDSPPELEIRFDMDPKVPVDLGMPIPEEPLSSPTVNSRDPPEVAKQKRNSNLPPLPVNWQLRFVHNQLFRRFEFPSRFCPGAFHSTILRKAEFRSEQYKAAYFVHCQKAVNKWKKGGPKPLVPDYENDTPGIVRAKCADPLTGKVVSDKRYQSGIYLFTDRNNITHHFAPNFLPPYDTPEKRQIILEVLGEEWDEKTLSWKPVARPAEDDTNSLVANEHHPVMDVKITPTDSTEEDHSQDPAEEGHKDNLVVEKEKTRETTSQQSSAQEEAQPGDRVFDVMLKACALD